MLLIFLIRLIIILLVISYFDLVLDINKFVFMQNEKMQDEEARRPISTLLQGPRSNYRVYHIDEQVRKKLS